MKRFFGTTRTADDDCAETQYATENALTNPMSSILLSRVSNEWRRIRPVLISTRLFVTANSEVRRSITALSAVMSAPTIKMSAKTFAMLPPT